ncbi:hypothetical protein FSP39_007013 [Pinctada imbricata]|uniref:Uncharacterized protein n=1 Tax=Pinctada imbricata TaxID=66713 RepID=A0AA88YLX6_PINIB|nr:hypothetical protein FSP39_007013 [Pinctada imbricata]
MYVTWKFCALLPCHGHRYFTNIFVSAYSQQHEKKLVAAIDFGTTYSGYAYSTKDEIRNIHVCKSSQDNIDKHLSLKIPTSILLSPTKKVLSIGSEAETDYKALAEDDEHTDHYFFRRFKMELHKSEKLHRNTVIKDSNGRSIHAMKVFKLYITKLKEMLMTDLDRAGTMVGHDEIFWAGISPHNIMLALEPEVAALFVKESRMGVSQDRESLTTYEAGAKFLVMDLGGGTADLTAMEVTADHSLKQLKFSCGGDWGGESVNKEFWKMIESLVGDDVMEDYKLRCHGDYMEMDKQFETKKRNLEDFDNMDIKLDGSFIDLVSERRGTSLKYITKEEDFSYLFQFKGASKLTLLPLCVQKIFMPSLNKLLQAASNMLEETTSAVTDIIMVGGFSDSKIVRQMVKRTFPKHRVIEPVEASLAVLKGAVLYGHDPIMVSSRICKYTYGIEVTRPFMYSDPKELRIFESGQQYCGKAFLKLVEKGQEIKLDEAISTDDIEALYSDATFMSFNIYRSTEKEPAYVTEESCTYLGKLRVEFGPQKQKVKVWMRFGTSEIMVEGRDAKTEEPIPGSVTLDLLDNLQSE